MIRYKIEEICGDWAIYEVWETETEGGERCLLILDSRANAEYIKAILEHEARYPNAAVPYSPEVAQMSDEEVLAVGRLCCAGGNRCSGCPVLVVGDEGAKCFEIEWRVLEMAEKWLGLKKEPVVGGEDEKKTLEAMKYDICDSADYCYGACCECNFESLAKALYARGWRKQSENAIEPPCKIGDEVYCIMAKGGMSGGLVFTGRIIKRKVDKLIYDGKRWEMMSDRVYPDYKDGNGLIYAYFDDLVFVSKEEANNRLKEILAVGEKMMKGGAE